MAISKNLLFLLITIGIISSLLATCKKSECLSNGYAFKATWQVSPESDSINVGDTLNFISRFSNHPFDYNSNTTVDFSGDAVVNTTLGVYVLKAGATNLGSAIDSFTFIPNKGRVETDPRTAPDHIKQIYQQEIAGEYIVSFQMIANKKGIYALGLSDGLASRKNSNSCEDNAGIQYANNNNNHIYFLEQFYGTTNLPPGESTHGYCFKVK